MPFFSAITLDDQLPSMFRAEISDDFTATLTWAPARFHCDILGYKIQYFFEGKFAKSVQLEGADSNTITIENLVPGQLYMFGLTTYTAYEELSEQYIMLETPEGGMCDGQGSYLVFHFIYKL